jgi:DNA primase
MTRRIPQSFVDEIVARADLVELVGARVALKKAGREFKGLCPFHNEKTPSFTVSPDKGFYHCFGCGAHGTAISFLIDHEGMSFPEAVESLAETLGIPLPAAAHVDVGQQSEAQALLDLLREADQIYRRLLRDSETAVAYLKQRGIDGATAGRFGIGYAPDGWDTVLRALGTSAVRAERLVAAGLVIENEQGRRYDRFRQRIIFPIRDPRGQVIGFGGRVLGSGEPKYLNSPETPVFHKGQALYGLYETRQQVGRTTELIVVEGYLDVASLSQHGIHGAVATLGTATTADHLRRLTRLAPRIVFCFDGDRAGRAAAWRALETVLPFGGGSVELKFLLLPEGEDPDSLVRAEGADAFRARLATALPLSTFMIDELRRQSDPDHADGRARLLALARPLLGRLPAGIYRELLIVELAEAIDMPADRLEALLDAPRAEERTPALAAQSRTPPRRSTFVRKAIALLLHYPAAGASLAQVEGLDAVEQPGADLLRRLLATTRVAPDISSAGLLERFRDDPEGRYLGRLVAQPPLDDAEAAPAVLADSLERLVREDRHRKAKQTQKNRLGSGPSP